MNIHEILGFELLNRVKNMPDDYRVEIIADSLEIKFTEAAQISRAIDFHFEEFGERAYD